MSARFRIVAAALALSASGLVGLALQEQWRDTAYIPVPGDVPTIGFGSTGPDVRLGDKTTVPRGLVRLRDDVSAAERGLKACLGDVPLAQHEWDAYVSLAFNVGAGAVCRSSIPAKLRGGHYEAACATIQSFVCGPATEATRDERCTRPGGPPKRVLKGLENRRRDEYRQCMGQAQ